ncbi:hypothetical protein HON15_00845 [Candidatus Woesearchaeota archaeon]|nr:hypothetical protein [Candidatus Woesearchaeota archaeon]
MGKIITDLSLKDVLKYGSGPTNHGSDTVYFNLKGIDHVGLLRITISDINKGAFDEYEQGHLQFAGDYSFDSLKSTGDQEEWLRDINRNRARFLEKTRERERREGESLSPEQFFFRILERKTDPGERNLFVFYHNKDLRYKTPLIHIVPQEVRLRGLKYDSEVVRKILTPFVKEDGLDELMATLEKSWHFDK